MQKLKHLIFPLIILFFACDQDDHSIDENNEIEPEVLTTSPESWMSDIATFYREAEVKLTQICYPRAHDAANFTETSCTVGGNPCNTRTQQLSIAEMLMAGVREFDMRPHLYAEDNNYYGHHYTGCGGLGCNGDSFENMLNQIHDFLESYPEIVIVDINHFCETNLEDENLLNLIESSLGERLHTQNADDTIPLLQQPLLSIVDIESGKGKAIVTYEGLSEDAESRALGRFAESGSFSTAGSYANKFIFEEMRADQLAKFENFTEAGNSLFEISWTLTQNTDMAINCAIGDTINSIENLAATANANFSASIDEFINSGIIQKGKIPNIINIDFADTFVTEKCVRITELNLE